MHVKQHCLSVEGRPPAVCTWLGLYDFALDPMTLIMNHDLDILKTYIDTKNEMSIGRGTQKLKPKQSRQTVHAFCCCGLDLDPMTLTYDPDLHILKMYLHTNN